MKHLLIIIILACAALTGCRTSKHLEKNSTKTENTGHTRLNKTDNRAAAAAYVERVNRESNTSKQHLTAGVKVSIQGFGKDLSVNGTLRMKRDDVVRLSLRFLGMEIGVMEFTPQDVLLVDRYHKQYVRAAYSEVSFLRQADLDFYALQSLFWNELFVPGERQAKSNTHRFSVVNDHGCSTLTLDDTPQLNYTFVTHTDKALIEQVKVTGRKAGDKGEFCWTYADFAPFAGRKFPRSMEMSVTGTGRNMGLTLRLSSLNTDSNWNTRTSVSAKYTKRTVDEVLGGLKM